MPGPRIVVRPGQALSRASRAASTESGALDCRVMPGNDGERAASVIQAPNPCVWRQWGYMRAKFILIASESTTKTGLGVGPAGPALFV